MFTSNILRMVAIKLIGYSFHFHVAHLVQRELKNVQISTFHIKRMVEYSFE